MNFWRAFRQLQMGVQITIILSLLVLSLAILLVVGLVHTAGENLIGLLLAIGTVFGISKVPRKEHPSSPVQKKEKEDEKKRP